MSISEKEKRKLYLWRFPKEIGNDEAFSS